MTYMATSLHKNHRSGGHEIYNFGRTFLGHHYCTCQLNLFDPSRSVDKKKRGNIACSLYDRCTRNPDPGVINKKVVNSSLIIITILLVGLIYV